MVRPSTTLPHEPCWRDGHAGPGDGWGGVKGLGFNGQKTMSARVWRGAE